MLHPVIKENKRDRKTIAHFMEDTYGVIPQHHKKQNFQSKFELSAATSTSVPKLKNPISSEFASSFYFEKKRHPKEMWQQEIEAYLNNMADKHRASASTRPAAFNAIAFPYREAL